VNSRTRHILTVCAPLLLMWAGPAAAGQAGRYHFGRTCDGKAVEVVTLKNSEGMVVRLLSYGAAFQSIQVPDRGGKFEDALLCYDTVGRYEADTTHMGATFGPSANRIARPTFGLDGQSFRLDANNDGNHLHGGVSGVRKKLWKIDRLDDGGSPSVVLSTTSGDGEGGYPGELRTSATFTLTENTNCTSTIERLQISLPSSIPPATATSMSQGPGPDALQRISGGRCALTNSRR